MGVKIAYNTDWSGGYTNFRSIANMPINEITGGSLNVIDPDGDQWGPRGGSRYFGAQGTDGINIDPYWVTAHRIHSAQHTFVNKKGVIVPTRVFYSGTTSQGDIIEIWLDGAWRQITADVPTNPILSAHRYYWAEWYDKATSALQPELIFTVGANVIWNWNGGIVQIGSVTPTTLQTGDGSTWAENGFLDGPEGTSLIIINGTEYTVSGGFSTDTITVSSTAGISSNDYVFSSVYSNDTLGGKTTYDVCSVINNQVYYIDWNQRNVFISWNRNQIEYLDPTFYSGTSGLDDLTFIDNGYDGTSVQTFRVTIDSAASQEETFTGTGPNDASWDTSGYSDTGQHEYKVAVVADVAVAFSGSPVGWVNGEVVVGSTSNATGRIVTTDAGGSDIWIATISGTFINGETITGQTSGTTGTTVSVVYNAIVQVFKDGVPIVPAGFIPFTAYQFLVNQYDLGDGIFFNAGTTNINDYWPTHSVGDYWILNIGNTFSWSLNGVTQGSNIPITGSSQSLINNISISFANVTGHAKGDSWTVTAYPTIIRGWSVFSYTQPDRFPGEGWVSLLDSNGWTMKPQENTMYINAKAGHFYTIKIELSSNLRNEIITIQRLKSEPQNRALFPYLINYIKNQFSIISLDKTFDILGRQKFLELPQTKSISDVVRSDFLSADWEDSDILYFKRRYYFSIPKDNKMFIFDDYKKYWQAPSRFAKVTGLLAVIDDKLIAHSYEKNESYEIFTADLNDLDIYPIDCHIVYAYQAFGDRFMGKSSAFVGFEGFIANAPEIKYHINFDIGGCSGVVDRMIVPQNTKKGLCIPLDTSSLGMGSLGHHGLGNDPIFVPNHFQFIDFYNNYKFFQRNIEISCNSKDQHWALIAVGTDVNDANSNNEEIINRSS